MPWKRFLAGGDYWQMALRNRDVVGVFGDV